MSAVLAQRTHSVSTWIKYNYLSSFWNHLNVSPILGIWRQTRLTLLFTRPLGIAQVYLSSLIDLLLSFQNRTIGRKGKIINTSNSSQYVLPELLKSLWATTLFKQVRLAFWNYRCSCNLNGICKSQEKISQ